MSNIINNNTWYYLPITTATSNLGPGYYNNTFMNAETLLNTSSIYSKNSYEQVLYGNSNYIPIPNNNYGIVCGTRVLPKVSGNFQLNIISSSGIDINCYYTETKNTSINTSYRVISGTQNTNINNVISMNANTEYSIILTQQNTNINSCLFINTSYYGKLLPINKAFNGTIINNKFS